MMTSKIELLAYEALRRRVGCLFFGFSWLHEIVGVYSEDGYKCKCIFTSFENRQAWVPVTYAGNMEIKDLVIYTYSPRQMHERTLAKLHSSKNKRLFVKILLEYAKYGDIAIDGGLDFSKQHLIKRGETLEELAIEGELHLYDR